MTDDWFRWEREAAIHLLFPTLEGSMKPLQDFTGYGFPTTILAFKKGIVIWCVKNSEFYGLGAKLLAIYKDSAKEQEMVDETEKRLTLLQTIEEEIGSSDLTNLMNESLADLYRRLHEAFINYYGIGAIQEPLAMQAEIELGGNSSHLIIPSKISYVQEADNYLFQTKDIDGFIKKYYWIENNYSGTKEITKDEVEKRLANIKPTEVPVSGGKQERRVELLSNFATYQDVRKKNILIYLHFLEILLKEVGKRGSISLELMRDTFPSEIEDILDGKISEEFIDKRKEDCFVVWEEGKSGPVILTGEDSKEWEEKLFSKTAEKNLEVKGNCASKGKVQGKVRVLLNASENDSLEKGEVLVTFMTSPDFMGAIRKCSAIVTNLGGITSHAAIISRELGIPCIVGTKNATEILKTGDLVEVDADKGLVKKIN